jgi:hypothetical protein
MAIPLFGANAWICASPSTLLRKYRFSFAIGGGGVSSSPGEPSGFEPIVPLERTNARVVRERHERQRAAHVNGRERLRVVAGLVVLPEVRGRVEDRVAPGERRRERLGASHVSDDPRSSRVAQQAARLRVRPHEPDDLVPFGPKRAHEVVSEQPGRSGDECFHAG